MIVDKFKYAALNGAVYFFSVRLEILFLDKFSAKNQNCKVKLKFDV